MYYKEKSTVTLSHLQTEQDGEIDSSLKEDWFTIIVTFK